MHSYGRKKEQKKDMSALKTFTHLSFVTYGSVNKYLIPNKFDIDKNQH